MGIKDDILGVSKKAPINSKNKGNLNERAVAKWLSRWTGKEFVRTPQSGGIRWQNSLGLNICGDVVCTEQGHNFPFTVETKHLKGISFEVNKYRLLRDNSQVLTIYEQVHADSLRADKLPIMFLRCNGMEKNTWWVFLENDNVTGSYLDGHNKTRLIFTSDRKLVGIHSDDLMNNFTYGWVCSIMDGRSL